MAGALQDLPSLRDPDNELSGPPGTAPEPDGPHGGPYGKPPGSESENAAANPFDDID
jgi:hypothetical protein